MQTAQKSSRITTNLLNFYPILFPIIIFLERSKFILIKKRMFWSENNNDINFNPNKSEITIKFVKIINEVENHVQHKRNKFNLKRCCSTEPIIITEQLPSATNESPRIIPSPKRASIAPNLSIQNTRHIISNPDSIISINYNRY